MPPLSHAQVTATNAPAPAGQTPANPKKHGPLPFHGNLSAADTKAMTLTVGTLTMQVTSDTKIAKDGKAATLADGVVGDPVGGVYKKTDDGKLNAISVHFGARKKEASAAGGSH
jgi:hypothetical protein